MNWKTWSPFQSQDVKDICEHMTEAERQQLWKLGGEYGEWVAKSIAVPVGGVTIAVFGVFHFLGVRGILVYCAVAGATLLISAVMMFMHRSTMAEMRQAQREFLCNTQWARERGIQPDQLKMISFGRRETWRNLPKP